MSEPTLALEKRDGQFGKLGRPVQVLVNCFEANRLPKFEIQQYDVSFSDPKVREKRMVMDHLIKTQRVFGDLGHQVVYDGNAILYMPGDARQEVVYETSEGAARGRPSRPDRPGPVLQVKLKHALTIDMTRLAQLVEGKLGNPDANLFQAINALNVAMKWDPSGIFPSRKNNFYVPPAGQARSLGTALEVWEGFFTSVRPGIGKMIMNFDRAAGTFKSPGNAVQIMMQHLSVNDPHGLELSRMPGRLRPKFKRFLKKLVIKLPQVHSDPNQKYTIRAVSDESAAQFFFDNNGRNMSVADYIQDKYNIRLRFPFLPCVQVTKIAWYPLELCEIQRGTQVLGKLGPDQVQQMLKFTTQRPNDKLNSLREGLKHLKLGGENKTLKAWNFDVNQSPMVVNARLLEAPGLEFADPRRGQLERVQVQNGQWDAKGARKPPPVAIQRWFVVIFASDRHGRDGFPLQTAQTKIGEFIGGCRRFGIEFTNERPFILHAGETPDVLRAIKDAARRAGYSPDNLPQFCLTFCLNKSSPEYSGIKTACDVQLGIPSQNLLIMRMQKTATAYWGNVALKVNVKLQGVNHRIHNWLPGFDNHVTMVMGADVTHPGPGSLLPSIAGVVGSCDPYGSQYHAAVRAQNSREEIMVDLEDMAYDLIKNYGNTTGKAPQRIVFYRDGVSEGQFEEVARREITAIKKACTKIKATFKPEITFIICGKRHHVKMFPQKQNEADRSGNVRAGTVIDRDVASPYYSDFYLLSHSGLLGTSKPSHYTVLLNESKISPDQLQTLTYHLSHVYARSTRAVSIAAPVYYSHLVCFRARHWAGNDDDASTEGGSMSPEQEDAAREQRLERAKNSLGRGIHQNLHNTLYWM